MGCCQTVGCWTSPSFCSVRLHQCASRCSSKHQQRISAAQHSAAQHSTAQHSTAQHSTAQHSTAQHSTAQHSTALTKAMQGCSTSTECCQRGRCRKFARTWVTDSKHHNPRRRGTPAQRTATKRMHGYRELHSLQQRKVAQRRRDAAVKRVVVQEQAPATSHRRTKRTTRSDAPRSQ
jgi:hypothetical protein